MRLYWLEAQGRKSVGPSGLPGLIVDDHAPLHPRGFGETVSKPMKSLVMNGIQPVIAIRLLCKRERWITRNQSMDQYP